MIFDLIVYVFAVIGAVLTATITALGIFSKMEKDSEPDWDYEFDDYILKLGEQPMTPDVPMTPMAGFGLDSVGWTEDPDCPPGKVYFMRDYRKDPFDVV